MFLFMRNVSFFIVTVLIIRAFILLHPMTQNHQTGSHFSITPKNNFVPSFHCVKKDISNLMHLMRPSIFVRFLVVAIIILMLNYYKDKSIFVIYKQETAYVIIIRVKIGLRLLFITFIIQS